MGFWRSGAEDYIWMRQNEDHYEYIAVYVDDLLIAAKKPQDVVQVLQDVYSFKL